MQQINLEKSYSNDKVTLDKYVTDRIRLIASLNSIKNYSFYLKLQERYKSPDKANFGSKLSTNFVVDKESNEFKITKHSICLFGSRSDLCGNFRFKDSMYSHQFFLHFFKRSLNMKQ